jgi:hypothetical protein
MTEPTNLALRLLQLQIVAVAALLINVAIIRYSGRRPFYLTLHEATALTYGLPALGFLMVIVRAMRRDRSSATVVAIALLAAVGVYVIGGWLSFYVSFLTGALF